MSFPFIVIEGVDGVGKSTLVGRLADKLEGVAFHSPCGDIGKLRHAFDECGNSHARYLYYLAAITAEGDRIRNQLEKTPVIFDRYLLSTICYHAEVGVPICHEQIDLLNLPKPTLTVCLTASSVVRMERIAHRNTPTLDRNIEARLEYLDRVQRRMACYSSAVLDTTTMQEETVLHATLALLAPHFAIAC